MESPAPFFLQKLLRQTLQAQRLKCHVTDSGRSVTLPNGLRLEPFLMACEEAPEGRVHSTTVVEASHPSLFPNPLFEYQHSNGSSQRDALSKGFASWASMDLVTLIDACQTTPQSCSALEIAYGSSAGGEVYRRQVLLGPMEHYQQHAPRWSEDHEFCPCCLFTNSMQAFSRLLQSHDILGVRLYASRDPDGQCEADCRVNGHDFAAAVPLLCAYANLWPEAGMEYRKQYVVIRNTPRLLE
ncbi:hypothetical protein G7047_26325 [Diaphorobacter sp. HDW4A]|uniref:DUF6348 family protein n=1 Tax=Diaphorobacter sp. HDW4A TaxID=2714924 RepID=UPI00140CC955|nr:DUF6348 family protein [Diaphorobacter sp. HDW4A]QIL83064.1 hypothetical protein G7047_26325 [Diaphorobacter sp. HDW4A]